MATLTNTANSTTLDDALGNPTLGASDIIRLDRPGNSYSTSLGSLDAVQVAQFIAAPAFMGDLGSGTNPLVVQADEMWIMSSSPNQISLGGLGSGTVDLMHIELQTSAAVNLKEYDITKLRVIACGMLTIEDSVSVGDLNLGGTSVQAIIEPGSALTNLRLTGRGNSIDLGRDCTNVFLHAGASLKCTDDTATPAVVTCHDSSVQLLGGTITITCGGGNTVIDLSKATTNCTITWSIIGDVTIKRPPEGITMNEPTDAQILSGRVRLI